MANWNLLCVEKRDNKVPISGVAARCIFLLWRLDILSNQKRSKKGVGALYIPIAFIS
jgi:hypothetical protein